MGPKDSKGKNPDPQYPDISGGSGDPDDTHARRTTTHDDGNGGDKSRSGPTFTGEGDYVGWKLYWQGEGFFATDATRHARDVMRSLRGAALGMVVRDATNNQMRIQTQNEVYDILDPLYGEDTGLSEVVAKTKLIQCRQRNRPLDEYLREIMDLSVKANHGVTDMIISAKAGVRFDLQVWAQALSISEGWPSFVARLKQIDATLVRQTSKQTRRSVRSRAATTDRDLSRVTCFKCRKQGHLKSDCPTLARTGHLTEDESEADNESSDHEDLDELGVAEFESGN